MDSHEVGIKISTIRKEKGWTQKDIAEISRGEKDRLVLDIWKRIGLLLGIIVVFFVVIVFVLVVGSNKESRGMLFDIKGTGLLEIIPSFFVT